MRTGINPQLSVERFFQLSLWGLVASGYLAVAGSGFLDAPTIVLTGCGLILRALLVTGVLRFQISDRLINIVTLAFIGFYPIDYFFVSHGFFEPTLHLVLFLAVVKILTARTNRDYLYTAVIAFLEILAAAILSASLSFLVFLGFYLLSAVAAFTSAEIRRAMQKPHQIARSGLRRFHPRLAGLATLLTCGILILTAGLFFLLPRSPNAVLSRMISRRIHLPGFSSEVSLDQIGTIKNDSSAVMHIRPVNTEFPGNLRWRGIALSQFDGNRWTNARGRGQRVHSENEWVQVTDNRRAGAHFVYEVTLNAVDSDAIFVDRMAEHVSLPPKISLIRGPNDNLRLGFVPPDNFRYSVYSVIENSPDSNGATLSPAVREQDLELPPSFDPRVRALAGSLVVGLSSDDERARAIEKHLRTSYGYTLELPSHEARDPIANFLFERKKGHCEYFASAMTVMLRAIGIPARLVNGFQSGTLNPITKLYVVRASDAHSWVEAFLKGRGWTTFDPTPPDPNPPASGLMTKLAMWADAADTLWQDWVLRYDLNRQLVLAERMQNSSRYVRMRWLDTWNDMVTAWRASARQWVADYGAPLVVIVLLSIAGTMLGPRAWRALHVLHRVRQVRDGRASSSDATLLYARMLDILRRRGFQKPAWFTPREFAASLPAETGMLVDQLTAAYNELRFGGRLEAASRLTLLLEELETGRTGIPALLP